MVEMLRTRTDVLRDLAVAKHRATRVTEPDDYDAVHERMDDLLYELEWIDDDTPVAP